MIEFTKEKIKRKTKNAFLKIIFSRFFITVLIVLLEWLILMNFFRALTHDLSIGTIIFVDFIISIIIINTNIGKISYKLSWIMLVNLFPGIGFLFYIFFILQKKFVFGNKNLKKILEKTSKHYIGNYEEIKHNVSEYENNSFLNYCYKTAKFVPYSDYKIKYFDNGRDFFEDVIRELNNAKKFIFIEVFILNDGIIWDRILKILKNKVKEGVCVKLLYDGLNTISSFNISYLNKLKTFGIHAKMFSPIAPLISSNQNNRDHRKLIIIDNNVAYTGGINIADEYANIYEKYGVWKDSGIKINGEAVRSMTLFFLEVWYMTEKISTWDIDKYLIDDKKNQNNTFDKYIIPYEDFPNDEENVSEQLFKMMFNYSFEYIYIMTPYLILDESMIDTIIRTRKRGVDVKIITPHIPDKKLVFYVTRKNYSELLKAGVEIYEYKKGFVHSKVLIQDDLRAIVGTANLDFRSLYLHYENGVYIYNDEVILDIKKDFNNILKECIRINTYLEIPFYQRFIGSLLNIFSNQL